MGYGGKTREDGDARVGSRTPLGKDQSKRGTKAGKGTVFEENKKTKFAAGSPKLEGKESVDVSHEKHKKKEEGIQERRKDAL